MRPTGAGFTFRISTNADKAPIAEALGPRVAIANPLDYQTYCWGDRETMQAAYSAMAANRLRFEPAGDRLSASGALQRRRLAYRGRRIRGRHSNDSSARGAFVVGMPENILEEYAEDFRTRGMVALYGIEEAIRACEIAADIGAAWQRERSRTRY